MARQRTITAQIGKYLIEIIIIILGISASFALNEWSKKQSNHTDYKKYLESLKIDIQVDSAQMIRDLGSYTNIARGTELILRYDDKNRKDSLLNFALAVGGLDNFIEFLPNNNTFQMLSSTGGFNVFENQELVKEIIQLYQFDYAFIKMIGTEANNEREDFIKPYLFKNIYLEDRETFPNIKTNIPKLINDVVFRNLCYSYGESCWGAVNSYRRAIKRLVKVAAMIEEELKKP